MSRSKWEYRSMHSAHWKNVSVNDAVRLENVFLMSAAESKLFRPKAGL